MKQKLFTLITAVLLAVILLLYLVAFQVRENEKSFVARFGKITRTQTAPGLYWKWPWPIEKVYRFDGRIRVFEGLFQQTLTKDGHNLIVQVAAGWSIQDPRLFYESLGTPQEAEKQLEDLVRHYKNQVIGEHYLSDFVAPKRTDVQFDQIENEILAPMTDSALLCIADIKQPQAFATKLRQAQDPLSKYIKANLTPATQKLLDAKTPEAEQSSKLQSALVAELNSLIQRECIYDDQRFASVRLSGEVKSQLAAHPQGKTLARVNRALLDAAYEGMIGKPSRAKDANDQYGIQIHFVRIAQLGLPEDITQDVFARMRKERMRIAQAIESEGKKVATEIRARADSQKKQILAKAEAEALKIRGEGDSKAAAYYDTFMKNPKLTIFLAELEALKKLKNRTTLVLDQNTPPFNVLAQPPEPQTTTPQEKH